jgi:hypothetical protein
MPLNLGANGPTMPIPNPRHTPSALLMGLVLGVATMPATAHASPAPSRSTQGFLENKGQVLDAQGMPATHVRFLLDHGDVQVFLLDQGMAFQFTRVHHPEGYLELLARRHRTDQESERLQHLQDQVSTETYRMDLLLEGMASGVRITTAEPLPGVWDHYTRDVFGVRHFGRVIYHDVYPGIDWVVYLRDGGIKYDFIVHPGADPRKIRLRSAHHEELALDEAGRLLHGNRLGRFVEEAPVSFQDDLVIPTRFALSEDVLSFEVDAYDPARTLLIDPARVWGTYIGSTFVDWTNAVCTDAAGYVYATGRTRSETAIADGGHQLVYGGGQYDAFLIKYAPDGTFVWGTYYGGDQLDEGISCCTDGTGNVYMSGYTESSSGISFNGHQNAYGGGFGPNDAFLVKFNTAGARLWATYYGGTSRDEDAFCATDPFGNVYMAGITSSAQPGAIAFNGHQNTWGAGALDAFLVKFNASGVRQWGTYYGGSEVDGASGVGTDAQGNVYMCGGTRSIGNISFNGHQNVHASAPSQSDGFLVKFSPNGMRIRGTYYGGELGDGITGIAVQPDGTVYLAGITFSTTGIAAGGFQDTLTSPGDDAFLAKLDSAGVRQWGTYFGGLGVDGATGVAVDATGDVFMAGKTNSNSLITFQGYQNTYAGANDGFFAKFLADGTRVWSSYYGGPGGDDILGCTVDDLGNLFLCGLTSSSSGIADAGHQNTFAGTVFDGFVVKMDVGISTSVPEQGPAHVPVIWPNPNDGYGFAFDLGDTLDAQGNVELTVLDLAGRVVLRQRLQAAAAGPTTVHFARPLETGAYVVRVAHADRMHGLRLVVE